MKRSHLRLIINNETKSDASTQLDAAAEATTEQLRVAFSIANERWGRSRREADRLAADNSRRRYIAAPMGSEKAAAAIIQPDRKWGFN